MLETIYIALWVAGSIALLAIILQIIIISKIK